MATEVKTDEALTSGATVILNTAEKINDEVFKSLDSEINAKVGDKSVWSGQAASKARGVYDDLASTYKNYVDAIVDFSNKLNSTYNFYDEANNESILELQKIAG